MFFSKELSKFKNLKHCFFSRKYGVSKGIYKSLNCGLGSADSKRNVLENLKIISNKMGCKNELLITLNQKHSANVIYFKNDKSVKNKLSGDAIIAYTKNVGISILSADCVPILFYESNKKIIGCVHAGWKGVLRGIIKNTIKKLTEINCDIEKTVFAIGPCIEKENYEVGFDLYKKFINENKKNEIFFEKKLNNKYLFDLRGVVNSELLSLKVKKIDNVEMNTFSDEKNFFSYRRSCIKKEENYGRCISVILMT